MEKEELRKTIYSKIDEIPTLPAVVPKLLRLIENEKSNADDIANAISSDPALTSKILKVANSAYYGFAQEISSLDKAVPLLGFNMVKSLALSIGVIRSLPSQKGSSRFSRQGLWTHSLTVATAMEKLGSRLRKGDDGYLFVIGLLHDIGKIVLDQFFCDLFQRVLEEADDLAVYELYLAERTIIGFDHGEVGSMLLTRWKFPTAISDPIAIHHQREVPEGINAYDITMLRIADALALEPDPGEEGDAPTPDISGSDLTFLGIEESDLEDIRTYLHDARDGINDFFSAMG
jgi:putative nucleotidyltransferase with HDIG domain